jgi:hypothetical protein
MTLMTLMTASGLLEKSDTYFKQPFFVVFDGA